MILHVLTPAEHLKWLTDQLAQWADASKEVYDKELQLHEANKALMELPPEALDDPAQKKQIQNQAAAEKANAAKLSALIDSGEQLVQEATKNEEFDPQQLDALAELLKKLEEIAGEQMPSVAELLAAAAAAPGQPANPPPDPPLRLFLFRFGGPASSTLFPYTPLLRSNKRFWLCEPLCPSRCATAQAFFRPPARSLPSLPNAPWPVSSQGRRRLGRRLSPRTPRGRSG